MRPSAGSIDILLVDDPMQADVTASCCRSGARGLERRLRHLHELEHHPNDPAYAFDSVTIVWTTFMQGGALRYKADVRCSSSAMNPIAAGHNSKNIHATVRQAPPFVNGTTHPLRAADPAAGHGGGKRAKKAPKKAMKAKKAK